MGKICRFLSYFSINPVNFYKQRFKLPLIKFVHNTVELYTARTKTGVKNLRDILLRGTIVAFITSLLVWLSIFMYAAFYYSYVPVVSHEKPVFLQFRYVR